MLHLFQTEAINCHLLVFAVECIARLLLGGAQLTGRLLLLAHALGISLPVAVHGALVIEPAAQSGTQKHDGQRARVPLTGQRHAHAHAGGNAEDLGIGQPRAQYEQQRKADHTAQRGGGELFAANGRKQRDHGQHAEHGAPADVKFRIGGHACAGHNGHERDERDQVQVDRAGILQHVRKVRRVPKERNEGEGIDRKLCDTDEVDQIGHGCGVAHAAAGQHMRTPKERQHRIR